MHCPAQCHVAWAGASSTAPGTLEVPEGLAVCLGLEEAQQVFCSGQANGPICSLKQWVQASVFPLPGCESAIRLHADTALADLWNELFWPYRVLIAAVAACDDPDILSVSCQSPGAIIELSAMHRDCASFAPPRSRVPHVLSHSSCIRQRCAACAS